MIPDIRLVELFHIGPIHLRTFGLLVAIGILAGRAFALHRAKQAGISRDEMDDAIFYILFPAFIFAHLVEAIIYHPHLISEQGFIYLLKIWKGLSSYGGFFGGIFGFLFFVYKKKVKSPLIYAECILQGLVVGWIFGRLGCTIVFDHPGQLSNFFLAFKHPEGARHNLGFYEFLFTLLILLPAILILHRMKAKPGSYSAAVLILYTPVRFLLDFLRLDISQNGDIRYFGLTPGQYGSMILFLLGIIIAIKLFKTPPAPVMPEQPPQQKKKRKK